MDIYIHSTRDLREAGFLWAQKELKAVFKGLDASDKYPGIFKFRFEIACTLEEFEALLFKYMSQEAVVEPKTYDQKLSNLRDNLRKAKSN